MNDPLWQEFSAAVNVFAQLCYRAPTTVSEYGKQHDLPTPTLAKHWHERGDIAKARLTTIMQALTSSDEDRLQKVNHQLHYFRQLPRVIAEAPPEWTTCYKDMMKSVTAIHCALLDIDDHYHFE